MVDHKYNVGDKVVFTNIFGVCWGIKTITRQDIRTNRPTYYYVPTDTPWFSTNEENLTLADAEDLANEGNYTYFQNKYGFTPTETYGCW